MRLRDVTISTEGGRTRLTGHLERAAPGDAVELFFEYPAECEPMLCATADPFLAALVPPAMRGGVALQIEPPISDDVFNWGIELQDLFTNWYPGQMQRVDVHAPTRQPMRDAGSKHVAAFFSLGVDSFYTLLKNMLGWPSPAGPITHLLYVEGLDTPLRDVVEADSTRTEVRQVADAAGKELIVGRTNVRDHFPLDYGRYYSGPCLSAVALSLAPGLSCALIAGTTEYARLYPSASHPLVEGRVRAGRFRVVSDGGELNRLQRIVQLVGHDPLALEHLRVCTQNRGGAYNCGRCQKCLRTMVTLHLMGTLGDALTFPGGFVPKMVRQLDIRNDWDLHYLEEIVYYAQQSEADPEVTRELNRLLRIHRRWSRWQSRLENTPLRFVVPTYDRLWRHARDTRNRFVGRRRKTAAGNSTRSPVIAAHER